MESMETRVGGELKGSRLRVVNDHWDYVVSYSLFALRNREREQLILYWHIKEKNNN